MTEKTRQPSLTIPQKYALMHAVKNMQGCEMTDAEFAAQQSTAMGRTIHSQTITLYREAFGIAQYRTPSAASLRAKVRELQRELELRGSAVEG